MALRARQLLTSTRLQPLRTRVRETRDRWIDPSLRQLEAARRELVAGEVDVLVLGESSCLSYAVTDRERTLLPELIGRRLGPRVVTVAGPGYGVRMYAETLRILGTLRERPAAVVVALNVRNTTAIHVTRHPVYGYRRSLGAMALVSSCDRPIRYLGRGGVEHSPRAYAGFLSQPVHTRWNGDQTVGDYRRRLLGQGQPPWPPELEAFRFDYFHGERVLEGHESLVQVSEFGRRLADYGVPAAVYWAKPPLQRGETHFPGEFTAHVHGNLRHVGDALFSRAPGLAEIIDADIAEAEFEDSRNATEHFALDGRVKIADAVATALAAAR